MFYQALVAVMFVSLFCCYAFSVSNVTVSGVLTLSNISFFLFMKTIPVLVFSLMTTRAKSEAAK